MEEVMAKIKSISVEVSDDPIYSGGWVLSTVLARNKKSHSKLNTNNKSSKTKLKKKLS